MTDKQLYERAKELYTTEDLNKEAVIRIVISEAPVEWLAEIYRLFDITLEDLKESLRRYLNDI